MVSRLYKNMYTSEHHMSAYGGQKVVAICPDTPPGVSGRPGANAPDTRGRPQESPPGAAFVADWKKTVARPRNGKIILEIRIDICYTDFVPSYAGTDETLPAPRGSVSADKFVRKVSNWKTIPSIS